jgi:hypothetical protein
MNKSKQLLLIVKFLNLIVDCAREAGPQGAPAGPMYAALMQHGCTLEQFESFMSILVEAKRLRKSGHLYFVVEQKE